MRQFWRLVMIGLVLLGGMIAGVAVTYVSVILPRQGELRRIKRGSDVVRNIRADSILEALGDGQWNVEEQRYESFDPSVGSLLRGKTFVLSGRVPRVEQHQRVNAMENHLQVLVTRVGAYTSRQESSSTTGGDHIRSHWLAQYGSFQDGISGWIMLFAHGAGDRLYLVVTVIDD